MNAVTLLYMNHECSSTAINAALSAKLDGGPGQVMEDDGELPAAVPAEAPGGNSLLQLGPLDPRGNTGARKLGLA